VRVKSRLDKIIVDGTGKARKLRNTVLLEGSTCGCLGLGMADCSRSEFSYWREIWLRRCAPPGHDRTSREMQLAGAPHHGEMGTTSPRVGTS